MQPPRDLQQRHTGRDCPARSGTAWRRYVVAATGVLATAYYASTRGWTIVIPTVAWAGGIASTIVIGAIAGLLPAIRAARLTTESLRIV